MFYYFDELTSTIDEAKDEKYVHGDVVVAEYQTAGRGQRGKKWSSAAGSNLMFSVVLDTSFLPASDQFLLLQVVALALVDTFDSYGLEGRIKWTNDIYIGDRKITGVLIDHSLGTNGTETGRFTKPDELTGRREVMLARSGVGIGINVNQAGFEEWLPNPTSMALEAGREFDRREVLHRFHARLMERFEALRNEFMRKGEANAENTANSPDTPDTENRREKILAEYHEKIYRLDTPARYALPDGTVFTGTIRGVGSGGELIVEHSDGRPESYLFREVSFVIP